jgi:hypothetical protein
MLESFWGGLGHSLRLPESMARLVVGHRKSYSLRRPRRGGFEHLDCKRRGTQDGTCLAWAGVGCQDPCLSRSGVFAAAETQQHKVRTLEAH